MCECMENDFAASASEVDGERVLRVEGTCTCPLTGYKLTLEPANPGINPDPKEVVLTLVVDSPDFAPTVLTRTPVQYESVIGAEAERVVIRIPDQAGLMIPIGDGGPGYQATGWTDVL